MGIMKDIVELEEYKKQLNGNAGKLVVVDFHAAWCPPCKGIAPMVKQMADRHDIVVIKVDVDQAEEVTRSEKIASMPTFKFYKNGSILEEFAGANKDKLESAIGRYK